MRVSWWKRRQPQLHKTNVLSRVPCGVLLFLQPFLSTVYAFCQSVLHKWTFQTFVLLSYHSVLIDKGNKVLKHLKESLWIWNFFDHIKRTNWNAFPELNWNPPVLRCYASFSKTQQSLDLWKTSNGLQTSWFSHLRFSHENQLAHCPAVLQAT